jgi:hypothetical protein
MVLREHLWSQDSISRIVHVMSSPEFLDKAISTKTHEDISTTAELPIIKVRFIH